MDTTRIGRLQCQARQRLSHRHFRRLAMVKSILAPTVNEDFSGTAWPADCTGEREQRYQRSLVCFR